MKAACCLLLAFLVTESSSGQERRYFRVSGPVLTSIQGLTADGYLTWTNEAVTGTFTVQTAYSLGGEADWLDFVRVPLTNASSVVERLFDPEPPLGMVWVPAGSFTMGDALGDWILQIGLPTETPKHEVFTTAFYVDQREVTIDLWQEVYDWAVAHGYSFSAQGSGKASSHPVQSIHWYDAVKWCNARSEREGRRPAYYTDATLTAVYRNDAIDVQNDWVDWTSGYRLPTEAEWEKSARGGLSGKRFPWGDTLTQENADYRSVWTGGSPIWPYDVNPTKGYLLIYQVDPQPYTSPAGSFGPNGYGLCDVVGNVDEWCWDWQSSYSPAYQANPHGPRTGSARVLRGGSFDAPAYACRLSCRVRSAPGFGSIYTGFRSVLPSSR